MFLAMLSVGGQAAPVVQQVLRKPAVVRQSHVHRRVASGPLQHIVVIIQENRSMDDLFNGFCVNASICADTVTVDPVTGTQLTQTSLAAPFGLNHDHPTFVTQYDYGKMDGFTKTPIHCVHNGCTYTAFDYAPASETAIYRQMATVDGVLADETFEPQQGPSLPAHYYAIAGQSGGYDSDRWAIAGGAGSCGTTKGVVQILMSSPYPGQMGNYVPPCKDFPTILDFVANAGYTWKYYTNKLSGWWSAPENIQHLYGSPNVIIPSTQFLTDVANGNLANVSFIMPYNGKVSDHPVHVKDPTAGPTWVASIINAIGETPFWNDTAIVVYWDDWGGFFDHVAPPTGPLYQDPFEYGFRVPLVLIAPYAKVGTIDHTARTFVGSLRLIEETFGLPSLGTLDQYEPDGLDSMLDFTQSPLPFTPLGGSSARPFQHIPIRSHATPKR